MRNILGMILYKLLVKYCESYDESFENGIFSDNRSKCMYIANILVE